LITVIIFVLFVFFFNSFQQCNIILILAVTNFCTCSKFFLDNFYH
jgi:hypothetical protein